MNHTQQADGDVSSDMVPAGLVDATDRQRCARSALLLRDMVAGRALVFFVGAGVSWAEPTRSPLTSGLLHSLFVEILRQLTEKGPAALGLPAMRQWNRLCARAEAALPSVARVVGLEITLSQLRDTWPPSYSRFLHSWSQLANTRPFNRAHLGLAAWMRGGGTVITTNYDCFIEEAYFHLEKRLPARRCWTSPTPPETDTQSTFDNWRQDLEQGGVLFKLHGSFHELDTCAATLDQVGTALTGHRADLVRHVMSTRPVCVIGWRGVDPDIPPVMVLARSSPRCEPLVWTLYQGDDPDSHCSLSDRLSRVPSHLLPVASGNPLVTEANHLFAHLDSGMQAAFEMPARQRTAPPSSPQGVFRDIASDMPCSAAAHFLAGVCRRAEELDLASQLGSIASGLALDRSQWANAVEAGAHVLYLKGDREQALAEVVRVREQLLATPDLPGRLTADFGELSMTIVKMRSLRKGSLPVAGLRLRGLFRRYRDDIATLEREAGDPEEIHLHKALYHLWVGRLRADVAGYFGESVRRRATPWILGELDKAAYHMDKAPTKQLDAKVDLLSYRALTLAGAQRCAEAWREFSDAERLAATAVHDTARTKRLQRQRAKLEALCEPQSETR